MGRALDSFEIGAALTGDYSAFNAMALLTLDGDPGPEALRRALDLFQARHLILSMRVTGGRGRYRFEEVTGARLPLTTDVSSRWLEVVEEELNSPILREEGPLARFVYLNGDGDERSRLLINFHHVAVDDASFVGFLPELLELWGCGETASEPEHSLLPPSSPRFPRPFRGLARLPRAGAFAARQLRDGVAYAWTGRGVTRPKLDARARSCVLARSLEEAGAERLRSRAEHEEATLYATIAAAELTALNRVRYGGNAASLRHFVPWDLRAHLEPALGARIGGCVGPARLTVKMGGGFWDLARRVSQQVRLSGRLGEPFLSAWASPVLIGGSTRMGLRLADAGLSYSRHSEPIRCEGPIRLLGIDTFISSTPIGPEVSIFARWLPGELRLDTIFLDTDMARGEAEALMDEMIGLLAMRDAATR